jgi:23S rRNA (guanosine2251-2'-O)-methyltransferase
MIEKNTDIVFGRHPVVDIVQAGTPVDKIILQQGIRGDFEKEIRHLSKEYEIPLQVVPKERLNKITNSNHQGVIAMISPIPFHHLEDVLPGIFERSESPLLVLLDGVTDVRNFGAIARSAEVCGAHGLVISRKKSAQVNAEAMKTSAGALSHLPICRESSILAAVEFLQLSGIKVVASDLQAKQYLSDLDLRGPLAIVVGSEGEGISPAVAARADECFLIPQIGKTDSFNVSVAAGIMLYETVRQRIQGG